MEAKDHDRTDPGDDPELTIHVNGGSQTRNLESRKQSFDNGAGAGCNSGQTPENPEPPSKRRRVALACSVCRARKSRCDGIRPKCSLCVELGFECHYQQSATASNVIIGKEYLSLIESRLKVVENRLSVLESQGVRTITPDASSTAETAAVISNESSNLTHLETASLRDDSLDNADSTEDPIDAMGAVTFAQEEDCAFFGPSSNIAFLRHLSRAVARLGHATRPWRPSSTEPISGRMASGFFNVSISRPSTPPPSKSSNSSVDKVNIYALPPYDVSRELIKEYFSNTGLLFPYIHQASFVATFEQASKDGFKGVKRTWLALLNIVFAHAVANVLNTSLIAKGNWGGGVKRTSEAEIYYRRASGLCSEQIMNGTGISIEAVQLLLLIAQYLQSTQRSVQTWTTHGLAVRAAFQLGLHSSDLAKVFSPLEQEIRKTTWYGCVMLDRTLSMTFGRPPTIPESYVRLDLPVPYATLQHPIVIVEKGESLSIAFYNGTITLYRVLSQIIDSLYSNNIACSDNSNAVDTVARVYGIETQLSEWQRGLPPEMKLINEEDITTNRLPPENDPSGKLWVELRLRFILTLRYTNIRILLHRPVLVKFLNEAKNRDGQDSALLQQIGTNSIQIAIRSSKEIICQVHTVIQAAPGTKKRGLLGAWWFSLYYTFNAALVLVMCILIFIDQNTSGSPTSTLLPDSTQDIILHLGMAIEALRDLDDDNRMVARCRDYLEQLVQVVRALAVEQGLLSQPLDWGTGYLSNSAAFDAVNGSGDASTLLASSGFMSGTNNKHSPLGMELGEFMLDGDLDFLSHQLFGFNRSTNGSIM
ncbi:fungal-specific transcription factor domain-containing protein [Xylogone sp. PMI_703]|nr:fungal-specific transcription factor domain-containing protein [Xylogone sp. PMI_703]